MPTKKSKLLPAIGIAGILAGGVATYLYFQGTFSDASSPVASAKLVPDEALMATFISTDPQSWSQLQRFGTPEAGKLVAEALQDFDRQVLAKSSIDFEKDLKPWVGSVAIAVLPSSAAKPVQATAGGGQEPNVLLVVGIRDRLSAWNFANKLKTDKSITSKEFNYKGQKITQTTSKGELTYSAVLRNHVVIAPARQAVEQAIDTFKGEPSFASKQGVGSTLAQGLKMKHPIAQIYLPDYASTIQQWMATSPNAAGLPPETLAQLQPVKALVAGVGVDEAGIRMKAIAKLDPNVIKVEYPTSFGNIVAQFPVDTLTLLTGAGISRTWSAFVDQTKNISEVSVALDSARQSLKTYNLDLDKDIFGWMDGEFAIGLIPSNQGMLAPLGFGGALMLETSDRATAEATLNKLDAIARSNFISIAPRDVGGKTITEWQIPFQGAILGHGWLDRNTMLVALGGPITDAIANRPSLSLDKSETFKAVTSSLPRPNGGYFYLDMDKTMSLLASKPLNAITPEASTILSSIRGIGMTASSPDKSTSQMELLVALKPKKVS